MNTLNNAKPVRIVSNDRIKDFVKEVTIGLESAIKFITEKDIKLSNMDLFLMPISTYLEAYKKKSVLLKIHAEESFHGEVYWFFELKTAVLLGALLRQMSPDARREKIRLEQFDATDEDSFGEVGNQLCGILDRIFRKLTSKKIHLRLDFKKSIYPNEQINIGAFTTQEEFVVFLTNINFPDEGTQKLTLLLPRSLFEVMLNMELQLEGLTPKNIVLYSWNKDFCQSMQKKFNTRFTKIIVAQDPDDILHLVKSKQTCAVAVELENLHVPLQHNDAIFVKRLTSNDTLMRLPFVFSVKGGSENTLTHLQQSGLAAATSSDLEKIFEPWISKILVL